MSSLSLLQSIKTNKSARRVGRGAGSTKGKTSARGHKGYLARTGSTRRLRFEGGQQPLISRIPKLKGFKQINQVKYRVINVGDIAALAEKGILNKKILRKAGLLKRKYSLKILGNGEITSAVKVEADGFSKSAKEKIVGAGGTINIKNKISKIKNKN
ncbi:MAG: 50S ribosomal protein L15 [Patescibacteria group bacterium]|nr:50S ribosomal protein L15 [Patescibacteria group bacterium]